jgi:hypothetical protein
MPRRMQQRFPAWDQLVAKRAWDASRDALVYWLLECPASKQGTLYRVESHAAFEQDERIEIFKVLSAESTAMLLKILPVGKGPLAL